MRGEAEVQRDGGGQSGPPLGSRPARERGAPARTRELTLADILWTLFRGRWIVAGFVAATLVLGAAWIVLATPIYQSTALIQVVERTRTGTALEDMLGGPESTETELEVIRSRSLLGKVVDEMGLDVETRPRTLPAIGRFLSARHRGPGLAPPRLGLSRFAWGGERLRIRRLALPDDISSEPLTLTALDGGRFELAAGDGTVLASGKVGEPAGGGPGAAKVEVLVTELVARPGTEFVVQARRRADVVEELQEDLGVVEKGRKTGLFQVTLSGPDPDRVASILGALAATYQRQHIELRAAEAGRALEFIESQLPTLAASVAASEAALNEYRRNKGSVDLTRETTALLDRIATVERSLSDLGMQRAELRQRFSETHPSVAALERKTDKLRAERAAMQDRLRSLPDTERDTARLARDVKVTSELYAQLLNKAQELRIAKAGTVGNVRIVDEPAVAARPSSPKRGTTLVLALFLGLGAGVAAVVVRAALREGEDDPREIEDATGVPVYVTVPHSEAQAVAARSAAQTPGARRPVLAEVDPGDTAVEALRGLRTTIRLALRGAGSNVLTLSSPGPSVGKTFVSVNLAHLLATPTCRVVLVDGDLRRGQLHRAFGLGRGPGLSDVVLGEAKLDAALRRTSVEGLDVLTTGRIPKNPAELLASDALQALLAELSRTHDVVMIDTPPVLAVTDSALLARHAGLNLLVLKAGAHPVEEIALTVEQLRRRGAPIAGIVLNDARSERGRYGGFGRYYRYEHRSVDHE